MKTSKRSIIRYLGLALLGAMVFVGFQNFSYTPGPPGSDNSTVAVKGQVLGACLFSMDASFKVNSLAERVHWPMLSCNKDGIATCAPGFDPINDAPVQMNCANNPSKDLLNCYWAKKRCVSAAGSTVPADFVRGQTYGSCLNKFDIDFKVTEISEVHWPMLSCNAGGPVCAPGFKPVNGTPIQMNCSDTPSKLNTLNCFWVAYKCAKI